MRDSCKNWHKVNPWEWYISFKFGALRSHLPNGRECLRGRDGRGPIIPPGASILDHVYHSLGVGDDVRLARAHGGF